MMINGKQLPNPASMLERWQEEYAAAFGKKNLPVMLEYAGRLYRFYAALGNSALARKWTEEYICCWSHRNDPPDADRESPRTPDMDPCGVALTL